MMVTILKCLLLTVMVLFLQHCYIFSLGGALPPQTLSPEDIKSELNKAVLMHWVTTCSASNCQDFQQEAHLVMRSTIDNAPLSEPYYRKKSLDDCRKELFAKRRFVSAYIEQNTFVIIEGQIVFSQVSFLNHKTQITRATALTGALMLAALASGCKFEAGGKLLELGGSGI